MKNVYALCTLCAAILTVATSPAVAQDTGKFALGAHASTLGFGPDLAYSISPMLTLRGAGNYANFDSDKTIDGVDYGGDVDLLSAGAFLDLHPFRNGFNVSLGALYNDNSAGLQATAGEGSNIGGFPVPPGQTVGLSGDVEVDKFSPYIGLGWDSTFTSDSNWSIIVQGGVLYQGDPDVTLRQTSGPAIPQSDLDEAARSIEDEIGILRFYPVISIGLTYRF
jgi:hypothetical protein